jgi:FG-GAP-like repeat
MSARGTAAAAWLVWGTAGAQFVDSEIDLKLPIDSHASLPGFDGSAGAILLTGRSASGEKHLALYEVRGDGSVPSTPAAEMTLPDDVLFFDTGRVGDRLELLLLRRSGVSRLIVPEGRVLEVAKLPSIYRSGSKAGVTKLDFLVDVNDDGLDDLVVPDFDGLRVALQSAEGFDPPELLELPSALVAVQVEARYRVDELYHYDFDHDGRKDLAVIRNNEYLVFDAAGPRGFAHRPHVVPIDIDLAGDAVVARLQENITGFDQSDFSLTRISRVADLNGDGLPDIVTFTAISTGLFDKRTEYRVHMALRDDAGIHYRREADATIPSDGFQLDLATVDVNRDGQLDLIITSAKVGFTELIAALFSRSVGLDIGLHRMNGEGSYSSAPDYHAKARLRFSISTGFISNPAVRFADFDGDGLTDLLLQRGTDELKIDYGSDRNGGFGARSAVWATRLPRDGASIDITDVNGDGRQDALIGYGRADGEEMPSRLRVLVGAPATEPSR